MDSSLSVDGLLQTEISLSLLSSLLNLLLLYILKRYQVFHYHLRSLCFQCQLFVLLSNIFIIIRGFSFLLPSSSPSDQESSVSLCPSETTPSFFIGLYLIFSIAICVERSYASIQYAIYESWTRENTITKAIFAFWMCAVLFYVFSWWSLSPSPTPCPSLRPSLLSTPVNDSNLSLVIFTVFFLSFIPIFYTNYTRNAATLKEYVRTDYSSFSSRFQMKENTTTCRRFLVQNISLAVLCLLLLMGSSLMTTTLIQREIQYLFYPLAGLVTSFNFLVLHESITRKLWNMYWDSKSAIYVQWVNSIHWRKEAEVPLLPT